MQWPVREVMEDGLTEEHPGLFKRRVYAKGAQGENLCPYPFPVVFSMSNVVGAGKQHACYYCKQNLDVPPANGFPEGPPMPGGSFSCQLECSYFNISAAGQRTKKSLSFSCLLPRIIWRHLTNCETYAAAEKSFVDVKI